MRILFRILLLTIFHLNLTGCAYAQEATNHGFFIRAWALDCEIAIPNYYKLNTHETGSFKFVNTTSGSGIISIDNYDEGFLSSDKVTIVNSEKFGNISTYRANIDQGKVRPAEVIIIHDKNQAITLIGDAIFLKDKILESCLDSKQENNN